MGESPEVASSFADSRIVDIKNLTKSNASERLYDVKVAVYESKASLDDIFKDKDPVVTMTGSMGY